VLGGAAELDASDKLTGSFRLECLVKRAFGVGVQVVAHKGGTDLKVRFSRTLRDSGQQPAHRLSFSRGFSSVADRRRAVFIKSAEEPEIQIGPRQEQSEAVQPLLSSCEHTQTDAHCLSPERARRLSMASAMAERRWYSAGALGEGLRY
jgi:hypothetical protein